MDHLRPGHAHRSSSDRLLSNYLESQKMFTTSLLSLLSQSHSSTSSLLAYVTSSPGVLLTVRRAVRHSAFEGPLSPSMLENPEAHIYMEHEPSSPGWAGYIRTLDDFRKDLKQIHLLEEEMTRVKRDKEILVGRLIKQTKARPTKSDLKDMAKSLNAEQLRDIEIMSSRASSISLSSDVSGMSTTGRETRRASKLKEAQAELLGCEEHLRALEVRIESERNKVMTRGLEERFRAMEIVGQMWLGQARSGLEDLEKMSAMNGDGVGGQHANAFELESNGSLAPSQSASQTGYDETGAANGAGGAMMSPKRQLLQRHIVSLRGPGSINNSIAEVDETGSSDDEPRGELVMHENNPRASTMNGSTHQPPTPMKDFAPAHSPSVRRAASELGTPSRYNQPQLHQPPMRRTVSNDHMHGRYRADSDSSSARTATQKRRGGFFASIARFFKGPKHDKRHTRRPGSPASSWNSNVRPTQQYGRRVRSDSSSDDDDVGNLVSVRNTPGKTWSAADVGLVQTPRPKVKRSASAKSRSTVVSNGTATPRRPASSAAKAPPASTTVSRSNTIKSAPGGGVKSKRASTVSAKSKTTAAAAPSTAGQQQHTMPLANAPPPAMPDVPKAPGSSSFEIPKAPGSSLAPGLVLPSQVMQQPRASRDDDELGPNDSISRSNSARIAKPKPVRATERRKSMNEKRKEDAPSKRPLSPLPPSKMRSPPLKSAMRPTSPMPHASLPPAVTAPPPVNTLYDVHAPGPVQLPPDEPIVRPTSAARSERSNKSRGASGDDEASIYESAEEDGGAGDDVPAAPAAAAVGPSTTSRPMEDSDSDDESVDTSAFKMVDNDRVAKSSQAPADAPQRTDHPGGDGQQDAPLADDSGIVRRRSVRIQAPSEEQAQYYAREAERERDERDAQHARELEKERARQYLDAAAQDSDDSMPPARKSTDHWDTRIGRMREDTSEDEDNDPRYVKARKSLIRNSGNFDDKKAKKKGNRLSVKSAASKSSRKSDAGRSDVRSEATSRATSTRSAKGKSWRP